jgi:predicted kinase
MIHGYLGAGKTTFARKLEEDLPAIRFSMDEWVTHIFGSDHLDPETMLAPVCDLIERCWTRCVELGLDVVLDDGFWHRKSRDETRAKTAALGAGYRLYFISTPDETAWARIEKRNQDLKGSYFIDRNAFNTLKDLRGFNPLGPDEPHIVIKG